MTQTDPPVPESRPTPDAGSATVVTPKRQQGGALVVFEQILIALALAFVFRAFVLEAFVIPTGSMATTLLGAHMRFDCPDCGYDYTVNYQSDDGSSAVPAFATAPGGRARIYNIRCPNCGYRLPPFDPDDRRNDAQAPPVYYGDRILVLKHLYKLKDPDRWDVVVFKNPNPAANPQPEPSPDSTEAFQENYIKRLVGLPGESLVLIQGDVFVAPRAENIPTDALSPDDFEIARKGPTAQAAMWRVVYDDTYRPKSLDRSARRSSGVIEPDDGWTMPWRSDDAGWTLADSGFAFSNLQGTGALSFDPNANPKQLALTDFLGYDIVEGQRRGAADTFGNRFDFKASIGKPTSDVNTFYLSPVADLKLETYYTRLAGDGPVDLSLSKRGVTFTARITPGRAELIRIDDDGERILAAYEDDDLTPVGTGRRIRLQNVDYRVSLSVEGEQILFTTDEQYQPDVELLIAEEQIDKPEPRPQVRVTAARQEATLQNLSLHRDVYFTARDQKGNFGSRTDPGRLRHGSPDDFPEGVIRLKADEFFVLGDNPFISGDARVWMEPLNLRYENLSVEAGRVPERFLMGKAFFVYWPGHFRPTPYALPIVPNFGDMRFIR